MYTPKHFSIIALIIGLIIQPLIGNAQHNYPSTTQQMTQPPHPQPASLGTYGNFDMHKDNTPTTPRNPSYYQPYQPNPYHEQMQREREQVIQQRRDEAFAIIEEHRRNHNAAIELMNNGFPEMTQIPGREHFVQAFEEMRQMLAGTTPLNLRRAVFLLENAFFDNKMSYQAYENEIKEIVRLCRLKMKEKKLRQTDNMAKNMVIFHFLADTFKVYDPQKERVITHVPVRYDFDDPWAHRDLSKAFVTKLINTGMGQCHSMPLLYLILAEELGAEAYMSYSPKHGFIRIKDNRGRWYNLELTSGSILTDQSYIESGYIKTAAIKNNIYLSPVAKKDVIADLMSKVGELFCRKNGYLDRMMEQYADTSLKYSPNNYSGLAVKSNYLTKRALTTAKLFDYSTKEELQQRYPKAYGLLEEMQAMYDYIDNLGANYDMPEEIYMEWLARIERQKIKQESLPPTQWRKLLE